MNNIDKNKIPLLCIVLYALAGVLVLYTIWAVSHSVRYIKELINLGQLAFKGNEYDIINFYMANSSQYAIYAVIFIVLGWLLQIISKKEKQATHLSEEYKNKIHDEDDLSDWFDSDNS